MKTKNTILVSCALVIVGAIVIDCGVIFTGGTLMTIGVAGLLMAPLLEELAK